jgi:hypothetical protein
MFHKLDLFSSSCDRWETPALFGLLKVACPPEYQMANKAQKPVMQRIIFIFVK